MRKRSFLSALTVALLLVVYSTALAQTDSAEDGMLVMRAGDVYSATFEIEESISVTSMSRLNSLVIFTVGDAGDLVVELTPAPDSPLDDLMINYMLLGFAYSPNIGPQVVNGRAMTPEEISVTIPIDSKAGFVVLSAAVTNIFRELSSPATFEMTLTLDGNETL